MKHLLSIVAAAALAAGVSSQASADSISVGAGAGMSFGGGQPVTGHVNSSVSVEKNGNSATVNHQTDLPTGRTTVNVNVQKK